MHLQHSVVFSVDRLDMIKKILTKAYEWGLASSFYCATEHFSSF